jgi:hypothetical protein
MLISSVGEHVKETLYEGIISRQRATTLFMHYEGFVDREEHASSIIQLKEWIEIAHVLGTDLILFPSNFRDSSETRLQRGRER